MTYGCLSGELAKRVRSKKTAEDLAAERKAATLTKRAEEAKVIEEVNRLAAFRKRQILSDTAKKYNVSLKEMLGTRRFAYLVVPRRECAWRLRMELCLSYSKISKLLNRKDHTTSMYAVRRYCYLNGLSPINRVRKPC